MSTVHVAPKDSSEAATTHVASELVAAIVFWLVLGLIKIPIFARLESRSRNPNATLSLPQPTT